MNSDMNELDSVIVDQLPSLRRFALSLTRTPYDADDLVQATVEKAILGWHQRQQEGAVRPWLFSILYRHFIDGQRRAGRFKKLMQLFSGDEGETATLEQQLEEDHSLALFAKLPEQQRSILVLVSVEGMSYQEVSEALDIPMGTVMSRLSRARQAYRQLLEEVPAQSNAKGRLRVIR